MSPASLYREEEARQGHSFNSTLTLLGCECTQSSSIRRKPGATRILIMTIIPVKTPVPG